MFGSNCHYQKGCDKKVAQPASGDTTRSDSEIYDMRVFIYSYHNTYIMYSVEVGLTITMC